MNLTEYARCDGLALAELVRSKEVSAEEAAALALEGFDKVNAVINAVTDFYAERAAKPGPLSPQAPFAGVPCFLKDLGAAEAGKPQEMGSRLAKGHTADVDAYLTLRLRQAGALILGRTATPEFGLAATTESILGGATRNPWNPKLIAGGSSGGSAAAVAAGIVPLAHASDGGGSIRIPAACCGVVGLKPSRGRITCGPDADERLFGLAQEFVVSRTVRDTAAMLDALAKPAPGDPYVIAQPRRPFLQETSVPAENLRIAFTTESWTEVKSAPAIADKVAEAARLCASLGHRVEEARPRIDLEPYFTALGVLWGASIAFACDKMARKMNRPVDAAHLEAVTLKVYENARRFSAADVMRAKAALNSTRRRVGAFFEDYDLLLTPTIASLPAPTGTVHLNQEVPLEVWYQGTARYNAFTNLFNATGQPAISLPLYQSPDGLPIGVQLAAGFGEEALLIRIAAALEQARPWIDRKPPIHVSR